MGMSFWQFGQIIDLPPQSEVSSVSPYKYENCARKVSLHGSLNPAGSVLQKLFHGGHDVARLWQNRFLEVRFVGAKRVPGRHTPYPGLHVLRPTPRNSPHHFPAPPPTQHI